MSKLHEILNSIEGWMCTICFDVDGTLINLDGSINDKMVELFKSLSRDTHNKVFIWSGGGVEYGKIRARQCGLPDDMVIAKGAFKPDIAFDDEEVELGITNLRILPW